MFTKIQQPEPTLYLAMTYISTSVCNMVLDRCLHISEPKIEKKIVQEFFFVYKWLYTIAPEAEVSIIEKNSLSLFYPKPMSKTTLTLDHIETV